MNGPKLYTHYKGGLYIVLDLCDDSNNENPHEKGQVAYVSVERQMLHIRSVEEFFEQVEWPDGEMRSRFFHTPTIDHIPRVFRERKQ